MWRIRYDEVDAIVNRSMKKLQGGTHWKNALREKIQLSRNFWLKDKNNVNMKSSFYESVQSQETSMTMESAISGLKAKVVFVQPHLED